MRNSNKVQTLLIILVLALGLGYAYINSDLNINGTAQVNSANWDVHWANVQVSTGSVSASSPTISNQTTVNYSVVLNTPGDYYEFTVDAVNGGSIDAMIDSIDSKLNGATIETLPDYLSYIVTYNWGDPLEPNHLLAANTTETYKVKIKYRDDIELNQIPATNQNLSLEFTVTYRQATDAAQEVEHIATTYTANVFDSSVTDNNLIQTGQLMPNGITQYSSESEALSALRAALGDNTIQFYLKHITQLGVVKESYVGFIITPEMASANSGVTAGTYALRGFETYDASAISTDYCNSEYYDTSTELCMNPYYESNKQILQTAFGNDNCHEWTEVPKEGSSYKAFGCHMSEFVAYAYSSGVVIAEKEPISCRVSNAGQSGCGVVQQSQS